MKREKKKSKKETRMIDPDLGAKGSVVACVGLQIDGAAMSLLLLRCL